RMKPRALYSITTLAAVFMLGQIYYIAKGLPTDLLLAGLGAIIAGIVYVNVVGNRFKLENPKKEF
ncbi:MAG: hypothetical protein ACRDBM_01545, partial [Sporomusa sp.]